MRACIIYPIHSRKAAGYVMLCMSDKRLRRSPSACHPLFTTANAFYSPRRPSATIRSYYAPSRLNKFTTEDLIALSYGHVANFNINRRDARKKERVKIDDIAANCATS